jgi:hypothetical protein
VDNESRTCDGETIVVNLHGALIATALVLSIGMRTSIHVYLTDKPALAQVVYVDPRNSLHRGIELAEPRNIWGVPCRPMTGKRQQPWRSATRDVPRLR